MQDFNSVKSVYIHVPFCKCICNYCDFCKNFYDSSVVNLYLKALKKEVVETYLGDQISTIYVGGGTPSSLSNLELDELFSVIKLFNLSDEYEFTFECNYEDINVNLLKKLKENKVNRLSIGLQTFNSKFEKVLGRKINKQEMIEKVLLSKKYFNNINVDLMYALPKENINDVKIDINNFINLGVPHISTYALIVEKHTKLDISGVEEIDDDTQLKMYKLISSALSKQGYSHYEISNFSIPGFESKHNLTYWNNLSYYGFGAGASGFINNIRYDNTKSVLNYIKGKRRIFEEMLSKTQRMKDEVMLNLRKTSGVSKNDFYLKYGLHINEAFNYKTLVDEGFLIENESNLYIPENHLFISNEIILQILENCNLNNSEK